MMHPWGGKEERVSSVGGPEEQEGEKDRITICEIDYVTTSRRCHFPLLGPFQQRHLFWNLWGPPCEGGGRKRNSIKQILSNFPTSGHRLLLIAPSKSVSWWMRRRIWCSLGTSTKYAKDASGGFQ